MRQGSDAIELRVAGEPVVRYVFRDDDLPRGLAPRPYGHPVRTLAGTEVTEFMPASHREQFGLSIAIPSVSGHNFWGGRTFLPGRGPTWLDNHGTQHHEAWLRRAPDLAVERLSWLAADGSPLLAEERRLAARPAGPGCWTLHVSFALTNLTGAPLSITSPAGAGRVGAGYGGFFWRAPASSHGVRGFGPDPAGPPGTVLVGPGRLHGRPAPWIALTGVSTADRPWTLIFVAGDARTAADPWFVRARDYPGVGSALAWDEALVLEPGGTVARRVATVVCDGPREPAEVAALAGAARS